MEYNGEITNHKIQITYFQTLNTSHSIESIGENIMDFRNKLSVF